MKKKICLVLSFLCISNLFGQEIFTSLVDTSTGIYINGNVKMVLLDKYKIVKDYCVKNYFPLLADTTILVGEDLIDFLDKTNNTDNTYIGAASFTKNNGLKYIVFNGYCFFDKEDMIRITCHELAHFTSASYEHNTVAYQGEVKRLKELGVDINTHIDSNLFCNYIKNLGE